MSLRASGSCSCSEPEKVSHSDAVLLVAGYFRNFAITVPHLVSVLGQAVTNVTGLSRIVIALGVDSNTAGVQNRVAGLLQNMELPPGAVTQVEVFDLSKLDSRTAEVSRRVAELDNPYPDRPASAVVNTVRFLALLRDCLPLINRDPRPTFFCRSDLLVYGDPRLGSTTRQFCCRIRTPSWHKWSGVNDRFAYVPPRYLDDYFGRFDNVSPYLERGNLLHGEKFLKHALAGLPHDPNLDIKLLRTRNGGTIVAERFRADRLNARVHRGLGLAGPNPSLFNGIANPEI